MQKQKDSLRRKNKQVICFNDKEMAAIDEYCSRFGVRNKSALFREAIMTHILGELSDKYPTLF